MKTRVVFGLKPDWNRMISSNLEGTDYEPSFAPLDAVDMDYFAAAVPLHLNHYDELRARRDQSRKFMLPTQAQVELCHDKLALNNFLIKMGLSSAVPPMRDMGPPYPYIWKPRRESWGRGCVIVHGPDEERLIPADRSGGFCQAYVDGEEELSVHILARDGWILFGRTYVFRLAASGLVRNSVNLPIETKIYPEVMLPQLLGAVVKGLNYTGLCCVNLKFASGIPMILEVNPRFGGSLCEGIKDLLDAYIPALS